MVWQGVIQTYKKYLPVSDNTPIITLKEGNTPLIEATNISEAINEKLRIFLKYEGLNPTASFKDRGMTMAISKAVEEGSKAVICASTGNTSASAAAYAAKAKLACYVLIPSGNIAMGKLIQAVMHGAKVLAIRGNFDDALDIVKDITSKYNITLVNSLNPYRIEGQKTASFEIVEQLGGQPPDFHLLPVGNAGNITAYWKGYKEYLAAGVISRVPKMVGFQAEGAAPIVKKQIVKEPKTIATAIKIGNPASWKQAENALEESKGAIDTVTDDEIIEAYKMLAALEGVFVEPASAASLAGLIKLNKRGYFPAGSTLTLTLTGHGLKDPDTALKNMIEPVVVPAKMESVLEGLNLL